MNSKAEEAILSMLNCFPQTGQNYDALLETLARLCVGLTDQAIIEAAERFAAGDVVGQSKRFAPSGPEYVEEARRRQEFIELRARPRLPPPAYRPGPLAPFELAQQRAWAANSGRDVIAQDVSMEQFQKMSRERQIPAGASWVASIGVVFGPVPASVKSAA